MIVRHLISQNGTKHLAALGQKYVSLCGCYLDPAKASPQIKNQPEICRNCKIQANRRTRRTS